MALGISRAATQRNNNFLNIVIHTGINQGFLPSTFKKVIGNNTRRNLFKEAYDEGLDEGFEYAKSGEVDADFFRMYWKPQFAQIVRSYPAIWKSTSYQMFERYVKLSIMTAQGSRGNLIYSFSKILVYMLRNKVGGLSSEAQQIIAQVSGVDLNVNRQSQNQEVIPQCQCVKTGMNGLSGGQVAEPNKINWGNVAKTVFLGGAAGFGVHKAIEHFTDKPKKSKGLSGLSKGQRKGFNKIQKITARARQIRNKNPRMKWQNAMKKAGKELK